MTSKNDDKPTNDELTESNLADRVTILETRIAELQLVGEVDHRFFQRQFPIPQPFESRSTSSWSLPTICRRLAISFESAR